MFRFGGDKKRYGFPGRLVKIKYPKSGFWDCLHTQASTPYRAAQTPSEIRDVSAKMRDAPQ
jgi:hypothetical protein